MGFILVLSLFLNAMALATDVSYQVDRSEDDAFRSETGHMFYASSFIGIKDPNYGIHSYFEFRNVTIYNSQPIDNATLSVYTTSNQAADLTALVTIYGLEVDDGGLSDQISMTTALTVWNVSQVRGVSQWHNVTVTAVVQELLDRFNWDYGDNIAFEILAIASVSRQVVAFDYGNPPTAAKLYISYGTPPVPPGLPEGATYNDTYEGYDIWWVPAYGQVTSIKDPNFRWDSSDEVYGFQEKTAYSNVTDRFYIFGGQDNVRGRTIQYLSKARIGLTWDVNVTLESFISGGDIYSDFHLWNNGTEDYLEVAWIDTYPATNQVMYCRYLLNANGSATNLTAPQTIWGGNEAVPPVTIMVDTAGYPYVCFATLWAGSHSGVACWSNLNKGTFNHSADSPTSTETGVTGYNPPNSRGPYVHELIKGGNRRVFCAVHVPDSPPELCEALSGRIINSGSWIGEGTYSADTANGFNYRWALSGSSIRDPSDTFNASITHLDFDDHELYERPVNVWVQAADMWDTTRVLIMGATTDGLYYAVGYTQNQRYSRYRVRQGSWGSVQTLRDFTGYGATHDIGLWTLTAHKYPTRDENKTIVSYAWRDNVDTTFWHDWFYLEDGPDPTTGDPYFIVTDPNGTQVYEDGEPWDWIDGEDPDPEDPEPGPWEGTPTAFSRFRMRLYFLVIGWGCLWGPIWFFCYRRPSGFYICVAFLIMVMGLGLLIQMPYV